MAFTVQYIYHFGYINDVKALFTEHGSKCLNVFNCCDALSCLNRNDCNAIPMSTLIFCSAVLLVVEHDVGPPDVIGRHVQHVHAAVLHRVPLQLVVVPILQRGK